MACQRPIAIQCGWGTLSAGLPGGLQLVLAFPDDQFGAALQLVLRCDVADGAVKPLVVVVVDESRHGIPCVLVGDGWPGPDAFATQGLVPAFDLPVALGVVARDVGMVHVAQTDVGLEVPAYELRAIVRDQSGLGIGVEFPGPLQDNLDISLGHALPDLPVNDVAAETVKDAAHVVERFPYLQVDQVDVPMLVRAVRLVKALALAGSPALGRLDSPCLLEDAVDGGRTGRSDVLVKHHVGQTPVALRGIEIEELNDRSSFPLLKTVALRNTGMLSVGP